MALDGHATNSNSNVGRGVSGGSGGISRASFRPSESRTGRRDWGGASRGRSVGGDGDGVGGFYGGRGGVRRGAGPGKRLRATLIGSLDLKPGYRLFETVPPLAEAARNSDSVTLDVNGKAPYGEGNSPLFFCLVFVSRCCLFLLFFGVFVPLCCASCVLCLVFKFVCVRVRQYGCCCSVSRVSLWSVGR